MLAYYKKNPKSLYYDPKKLEKLWEHTFLKYT